MSRMTILTEAELRQDREARSRGRCMRRERLPRAGDAAGRDAADPEARHSRTSRRGRREDRLCAGHRRVRHQDQPGFFDNPKLGLPSVNGMMVLLSAKTGLVEALLLDNGYLTDVRTAAAGAVAAKHLSRAGRVGGGDLRRRRAGAAAARSAAACPADRRGPHLGARRAPRPKPLRPNSASGSASSCAPKPIRRRPSRAPISSSRRRRRHKPILKAGWLSAGQHITAMGSDAEHKNELDPAIIARADLYVADSLKQTRRLGELHHAIAAGLVAADAEVRRARRRSLPGSGTGGAIAIRHHHRRPDRHRRAGHCHRHPCPRPRPDGQRRHDLRKLIRARPNE